MSEQNLRNLGGGLRAFFEGYLGTDLPSTTEGERVGAGDSDSNAFPAPGIDGFLSHFVFTIQFHRGPLAGRTVTASLPAAIQTVARSQAFVYRGASARHTVEFALPEGSTLQRRISEEDFLTTPPRFFESGKETIWLQILNLDARGDTRLGPIRIILGETFRREYPDIFQPSFGAAQSLSGSGLPARLFFSPNGIIETPLGAFRTRPKVLLGAKIDALPPVGSYPSLLEPVDLDSVEELRLSARTGSNLEPAATVLGLAHPIDALLHGEDVFKLVEDSIQA